MVKGVKSNTPEKTAEKEAEVAAVEAASAKASAQANAAVVPLGEQSSGTEGLAGTEAASAAATAAVNEKQQEVVEGEAVEGELSEDKKLYRLQKPFWNGRKKIPRGECYYFLPGKQPKTALLVK